MGLITAPTAHVGFLFPSVYFTWQMPPTISLCTKRGDCRLGRRRRGSLCMRMYACAVSIPWQVFLYMGSAGGGFASRFWAGAGRGRGAFWEGSRIAAGVERVGKMAILIFVVLQSRLRSSVVFCGRNISNIYTILSLTGCHFVICRLFAVEGDGVWAWRRSGSQRSPEQVQLNLLHLQKGMPKPPLTLFCL